MPPPPDSFSQHLTAQRLRLQEPRKFNDFLVFAAVRNPYDRFISSYFYLKNGGNQRRPVDLRWQKIILGHSFADFVQTYFGGASNVAWGELPIHFQPQHVFLCDSSNGDVLVDHLVRFENLDAGIYQQNSNCTLQNY